MAEVIEVTGEKYSEHELESMLEEILSEEVEIYGCAYSKFEILKEVDPIAFRCALADLQEDETIYICPICNSNYYNEYEAEQCCADDEEYDD